jgi:hypothetical protein
LLEESFEGDDIPVLEMIDYSSGGHLVLTAGIITDRTEAGRAYITQPIF